MACERSEDPDACAEVDVAVCDSNSAEFSCSVFVAECDAADAPASCATQIDATAHADADSDCVAFSDATERELRPGAATGTGAPGTGNEKADSSGGTGGAQGTTRDQAGSQAGTEDASATVAAVAVDASAVKPVTLWSVLRRTFCGTR